MYLLIFSNRRLPEMSWSDSRSKDRNMPCHCENTIHKEATVRENKCRKFDDAYTQPVFIVVDGRPEFSW